MAVIVFGDAQALAGVSRAFQSTSEALAESVMAAAVVLGAGANATASVVKASRTVLGTSATALSEMWSGVDVLEVRAELLSFRAVADSRARLVAHWDAAEIRAGLAQEVVTELKRCAGGEAAGNEVRLQAFAAEGSHLEVRCKSRALPSAGFGQAASVRRASFAVQWANPLWELAMGDVRAEAGQILAQILQVVEALGGDYNVRDVSVASFRPLFPSPRPTRGALLLQSSLAAACWGLRMLEEMGPAPWLALLAASAAARAR